MIYTYCAHLGILLDKRIGIIKVKKVLNITLPIIFVNYVHNSWRWLIYFYHGKNKDCTTLKFRNAKNALIWNSHCVGDFRGSCRFWLHWVELRKRTSPSSLNFLQGYIKYQISFYMHSKIFSIFFSKKYWVSVKLHGFLSPPTL